MNPDFRKLHGKAQIDQIILDTVICAPKYEDWHEVNIQSARRD